MASRAAKWLGAATGAALTGALAAKYGTEEQGRRIMKSLTPEKIEQFEKENPGTTIDREATRRGLQNQAKNMTAIGAAGGAGTVGAAYLSKRANELKKRNNEMQPQPA